VRGRISIEFSRSPLLAARVVVDLAKRRIEQSAYPGSKETSRHVDESRLSSLPPPLPLGTESGRSR